MAELNFSPPNRKLKALEKLFKRKLTSFSTLAGHNCPGADKCQSFAMETPNGLRILDGKHNEFRCFSASQEVLFKNVYASRKRNEELLRVAAISVNDAVKLISDNFPKKATLCRLHVSGDFKTQNYFDAWLRYAVCNPQILFYAYTKSIPFWVKRLGDIPDNFVLTASIGGKYDAIALKHNLRTATVYEDETFVPKGVPIDHDDSHAADPSTKNVSFALLLHGTQKGRKAKYGYGKMKGGDNATS